MDNEQKIRNDERAKVVDEILSAIRSEYDLNYGQILINPRDFYDLVENYKNINYPKRMCNMTDEEAILLLKKYFSGKRIMARYVSMALMVVSCSLPENITIDELKEFVMHNKRLWEQ